MIYTVHYTQTAEDNFKLGGGLVNEDIRQMCECVGGGGLKEDRLER